MRRPTKLKSVTTLYILLSLTILLSSQESGRNILKLIKFVLLIIVSCPRTTAVMFILEKDEFFFFLYAILQVFGEYIFKLI